MSTVAGLTGLSRIAGFIRDILTAAILGAGPIADAFFVALKLPNFFRRVTAEGAFSVAFVPLYSESMEKDGQEAADRFASHAFMMMAIILAAFTALGLIFMPGIISVIAPGFSRDSADIRFEAAIEFSRITFSYLMLMSLTALLGGVLNARGRFAPFAFAPVLFNLCLIAALLMAAQFETAGHALAWGVLAAGFLQFFFLLFFAFRANFRLQIVWPSLTPRMKKVFTLMGPGVLGAGVMHINLFVDLILGSLLGAGSISYLYYADRLNQLPLGVVGIAVGTALLPMLARALSTENIEEARGLYNKAMEYCLLLALPAALALAVIPDILIGGLFERGSFTATDTSVTARVLIGYALGLPAYIAIKVFSTMHWARQDTATPVKIAIIGTLANIALSVGFIQIMGVAGIALATGLTGWLQFILHTRSLKSHPAAVFDKNFRRIAAKIAACCAVMVSALFIIRNFVFESSYDTLLMLVFVSSGVLIYFGCAFLSGLFSISSLKTLYKK